MYEDQTFDVIMKRMLDSAPNDVDKREGSIIYTALAPIAIELEQAYIDLGSNLDLTFADKANDIYLDYRANELGLSRKPAVKAIRKGEFKDNANALIDVPIGSRYSIEKVNYKIIEKISTGMYKLECETAGQIGNTPSGVLLPLDYIDGLATARLTDVITPGEEVESNESLRTRYFDRARKPITSGNVRHYEQWAKEIPGIGDAKAFAVWNGPGTVKVVLLDQDKRAPVQGKVTEVANYIASVHPVGATVTVMAAIEVPINISATLTMKPGASIPSVIDEVKKNATEHFKSMAFKDQYVRYSRIANIILDADGVIDYTNLKINGGTGNLLITGDQVAVLGTVNLS